MKIIHIGFVKHKEGGVTPVSISTKSKQHASELAEQWIEEYGTTPSGYCDYEMGGVQTLSDRDYIHIEQP